MTPCERQLCVLRPEFDGMSLDDQAALLLAWGAHDVTADPPAALRTLALGHAARSTRIIEGGGHWVQYERADAVNAMLLEWLHN